MGFPHCLVNVTINVMLWFIPIILVALSEISADYLSKLWSVKGGWLLVVMSLMAYLASGVFWLFALKSGAGLARGVAIFSVLSAVIAILIGLFIFDEKLPVHGYVGIALGLASIALLAS